MIMFIISGGTLIVSFAFFAGFLNLFYFTDVVQMSSDFQQDGVPLIVYILVSLGGVLYWPLGELLMLLLCNFGKIYLYNMWF